MDVQVGQIWEDLDPRMITYDDGRWHGRRVRVIDVHGEYVRVENLQTGRKTRISLFKMKPQGKKRGYALLA